MSRLLADANDSDCRRVGEYIGDDQRRRDKEHAALKAELESLLAQIKEANAERKDQTEKLFILHAELRADVNELAQTTRDLFNRPPEVIVRAPPLRRRLDG